MADFRDGTFPSICRLCLAYCPIEVEVRDGRAAQVSGDRTGTPWNGYICPKGRTLPEQHNSPDRLLHPLKRRPDGTTERISTDLAVRDVADRLKRIVAEHGPESVAFYIGTGVVSNPTGQGPGVALMRALKSGMIFSASTIDKPAANVSTALHGNWVAGSHRIEDCDAWIIVGGNPVIAKSNGAPPNNPGMRLKERVAAGMQLIVIDPRVTETAKRATHHLQLRPGEDPALLAGLIHVILEDCLADSDFLARHAEGVEALQEAVRPFTPDYAAARVGVDRDMLVAAAHAFAKARLAGAVCSTGPSFATHSNLSFYLALCLNTICGHWPRAGQRAPFPNMLLPEYTPREQAYAPYSTLADKTLSATGLRLNASGLPTAGLSDQILTDAPDRIGALLCVGGNPVLSWPDQARTEQAMAALDLLVVYDFKETATAELADYGIPPPDVETLLGLGSEGSRIPLNEVRRHPHGKLYDIDIPVAEPDPGNTARLQVGDPTMMQELAEVLATHPPEEHGTGQLWLICRRANNFKNSVGQGLPGLGLPENPFSVHPDDLAALSLVRGQRVRVTSATGTVEGVIAADPTLRRGTVSLSHGFGGRTGRAGRNLPGTSVAELIGLDEADPVTGIPRMTGLPVRLEATA